MLLSLLRNEGFLSHLSKCFMQSGGKLILKKNMQIILIWNKEARATLLGTVSPSSGPRDGADLSHGRAGGDPLLEAAAPRPERPVSAGAPEPARGVAGC